MSTPDITPAQVVSLVTAIVSQVIAYGLLTPKTGQFVVSLVGLVIPFAWMLADAIIRYGRSRALHKPNVSVTPPVPPASAPPGQ